MLTNKAKYALKALIHLASARPNEPVLISDIAEAEGISRNFLAMILLELRNQGIVKSRKGIGGGYMLAIAPADLKIGPVIRAIEGPFAPVPCLERRDKNFVCEDCKDATSCVIRKLMGEVSQAMANILDHCSLEEVVERGRADETILHYEI